uniref:Uncharacterized protein n=1 Tax=Arundo donax TaxID=35708 RepID=A0A0A9TIL8_ARUDO
MPKPQCAEKCKSLYISFQADHANNPTWSMEFCNSVMLVYTLPNSDIEP